MPQSPCATTTPTTCPPAPAAPTSSSSRSAVPGLITAEHVADGAIVIDVGTTATDDGRLLGDVDADSVQGRAGGLTPVPGGVGPVTTALLLANTVTAATAI